jgi:hypothetical protein
MKSITRHGPAAARIVFGLVLVVFGLNGFLQFLPQPAPPEAAGKFAGALFATGYMFPLIKGVEVVVGALLLSNRFVPLALALIAPNVVNILLFHIFLAPGGIGLALIVLALELYLAWAYRDAYAPMLASRVRPRSTRVEEPVSGHAHA